MACAMGSNEGPKHLELKETYLSRWPYAQAKGPASTLEWLRKCVGNQWRWGHCKSRRGSRPVSVANAGMKIENRGGDQPLPSE